jgi:protein gp37
MGDKSAIEWTEATWNPTTGCDQTSPGCDHCYALTLAKRLKAMGQPKYQHDGDPRTSGPGFGLTLHPDALDVPRSWSTGRYVFVNSMSDLFHHDVPVHYIRQVFEVMADTPQHTYQVLTKRSKRLAEIAPHLEWPDNVWMGVSVETDRYSFRIDHLRQVPAAVRFLSCEPLIGPLGDLDLDGIHWVIAGGESGHGARPMDLSWVSDLLDQCVTANVAFFLKQLGTRLASDLGHRGKGDDLDEFPEHLQVREYPPTTVAA